MLSRLIIILTGLLLCCPQVIFASVIIEQHVSVRLLPDASTLLAEATITLDSPETDWPEFVLAPNAQIRSLSVDGVKADYDFNQGRLLLPATPSTATVEVHYSIVFDDPVPENFVGIEDPSYGVVATITPRGVYLSSRSLWHLLPETGLQRLSVTLRGPKLMTGVTSGRLQKFSRTEDETVTTWQTELQDDALTMAAGHYFLEQSSLGDIQVLTFLTEQNRGLAKGYQESVHDYLDFYQNLLGPYPYEKFAVVENFFPTGYGLPGWTLLGSSVVRLPFIRTTSLPHEIVHTWWGNSVDVDTSSGNWAEGLATYLADYYLKERNRSEESLAYRRKLLRDYAALAANGDYPLKSFVRRTSKVDQAIGYGKAAMTFHMLRELIGDEAFWTGLQDAAREGRDKFYRWSDLRRHFEKSYGEDLEVFFRQWIERDGAPRLALSDVDITRTESGWQVSGLLKQEDPVYQLAVPLRLVADGQVYEQVIGLAQKQDCFVFSVAKRPLSLAVDPDNTLFRKLYESEVPATVNNLRASRRPLVVVAEGEKSLLQASRDLLLGLQWHDAEVMSEELFLENTVVGRDVLFIGRPKSGTLQSEMTAALAKMHQQVGEAGGSGRALVEFLVRKQPGGPHVVAFFLPASSASARDVARRIPHYGQYSYLLFDDGGNRVKTTWETQDSRLSLSFDLESHQ